MTLSRWYRDSEMVVWLASGIPLTRGSPVLKFVGPPGGDRSPFPAACTLGDWKSETYRQTMNQRDDVARVSPGAFNESGSADRVFFVESVAGEDGKVKERFHQLDSAWPSGCDGHGTGAYRNDGNGDSFLVLDRGVAMRARRVRRNIG
jgi:lipopolysaccharide export system permease protein